MANNNQTQGSSRRPNYTMSTNGTENAPQILGNAFSMAGLQPGGSVWGNSTGNTYASSKDRITPRDAAPTLGRASTLGAVSDADPWGVAWNLADITQQARNLSGNTSPRSRSDASSHDINGGSSYYRTGPLLSHNNRPIGSKPAGTATLEPSSSSFNNASQLSAFGDNRDLPSLGDHMGHDPTHRLPKPSSAAQRPVHQSFFTTAGPSSFSLKPASDIPSQAHSFGDLKPGGSAGRTVGAQGPSLADLSFSSSHNVGGYDQGSGKKPDQYPLADSFARLSMNSSANGSGDGLGSLLSHGVGGAQNFQFNPVSQPWETGFSENVHPAGPGFEKRGSIVDRGSPAGSTYRAGNGLNSPRSFTGTPQPNSDTWTRPVSRDLGAGTGLDRRGAGQQPFVQQPPAPFFPNAAFYPQPYPQFPPLYGAYDPRQTVSMAGYGMPLAHLAVAPGALHAHPTVAPNPGLAYRDPFLEDFKSNWKSHNRYELKDIYGRVKDLAGDQEGSRFIQKKLDTANSEEKAQIFAEIESNAVPLMKCVFGNYVLQKLFDLGTQVQKRVLVNAMKGKVVDLSMQMYGCRVVQKALQTVLVEQQAELVKELKPDLLKVTKDQHGNHVVQVAIQLVPRQYIDFIMDGFKGRVCELASHQYGCRVIQRALEYGSKEDKASMMLELHKGAQALITDMYGNYVIQHVLANGEPADRSRIISLVVPQLLTLSRQKFASNVVEKCIIHGKREEQQAIRDQLIASGDEANSPLFLLMKDQYGNYVTQKLIKNLDPQDREVLLAKMRPQLQPLKRSGATSKQVAAIERAILEVTATPSPRSAEPSPASTAPTSPGLQVDTNSAAPTPNLTMDPNSPLSTPSSGPPDTHGDAVEGGVDPATGQAAGKKISPVQHL